MLTYYPGFEFEEFEVTLKKIKDSHNENCFDYLANIKDTPESLRKYFPEQLQSLLQPTKNHNYDPNVSYANLYTSFLTTLEINILKIPSYY
jgi:hypothetical protein